MLAVAQLIERLRCEDPDALVLTIAGPLKGGRGFRGLLHMERMEVIQNRGWRKRKDEGEFICLDESDAGSKSRAKRHKAFFIA